MRYAIPLMIAGMLWAAQAGTQAGARAAAQAGQHDPATHSHPEAAKVANPAAATPKSIAAGASVFNRSCASCHGKSGMGDGPAGAKLTPPPSNLVDAEWKHGTTDGEIFAVIRSGIPKTSMKGFASKMTEGEIWDVINYVRSLGPQATK